VEEKEHWQGDNGIVNLQSPNHQLGSKGEATS